ncbi:MAG: T9SS type A sorting domain-containing protein, partial [Balneolales bacterium]|nr:T9SS type A sorting domain-containing protein [Balneolales bacterium]
NELKIEVSSNGTDWTELTYSRATGTGTANWILINPSGDIPSTENLRIRFTQELSSSLAFRIDDITLSGDLTTSEPFIDSPTTSLTGFSYLEGNGPSETQSFAVSGQNLTSSITVSAPDNFEVSLSSNDGFSGSVDLTPSNGDVEETAIYTRLKAGLVAGEYIDEIITIESTDATTNTVTVSGQVTGAYAIPYDNTFRTQEDVDVAIAQGINLNDGTTFVSSAGGYIRITNTGNLELPTQNLTEFEALYFSMSLTTFGGNTGQVLSIELSDNGGTDYETVESFAVPGSYTTFTASVNLGTTYNVENARIRFRITEGSNQVRFRDLEIKEATVADLTITGNAGWRMLSRPVSGVRVSDLASQNLIQGAPGGQYEDLPSNFFPAYDGSTSTWVSPDNVNDQIPSGTGFIWFKYNNTNVAESKNLPFTLSVSGLEPTDDVTVSVNSGETWNLLGNPYSQSISVEDITGNEDNSFFATVQVWESTGTPGTDDGWVLSSHPSVDGILAPWQGFFLASINSTEITIPTSAKTTGGNLLKESNPITQIGFRLLTDIDGTETVMDRAAILQIRDNAEHTMDRYDLVKLGSLNTTSAMLYFVGENFQGELVAKSQESRPLDFKSSFEIPMDVAAYGLSGDFTIDWPSIRNLPDDVTIHLLDTVTGEKVLLEEEGSYSFSLNSMGKRNAEHQAPGKELELLSDDARFKLLVDRGSTTDIPLEETTPREIALDQNFPNPFNPTTRISYALPVESQVRLAVYDLLGREVAVLVNERMASGSHFVTFDASALSSGVYMYRLTAQGVVLTQKMTLIK